MDFITDLPTSEGDDAILIVMDRLTKMAHFLSCTKEMDARQFSELFMREIIQLHGLPKDIITDRGSIFASDLWKDTTKRLGIERRLSTAFHPQTDGQTERTNCTMEQYLRAYVNYQQDNWKELLPMAEFAYNNGYLESIKRTPFFANYGVNPEYQTIGHLMQGKMTPPEDMRQLHDTLQAAMTEAQLRYKEYYDAGRKPDPNLQPGDMVWLLPRNIRTTRPCKKLDYKKIGLFTILARIGESAYKLDLPQSMRINNTFHISLLELYHDDNLSSQRAQPPPPIIVEGEPEYELEQIIDSRLHYGKLQYRAKWTGYPPEHDKVLYPYKDFENPSIAKQQFHQKYPRKPALDQDRGTRKRGDLGLHNTTTATRTTTTASTNDNSKTPDTGNRPRGVGNVRGTTHEPPISSPTRMGRSGKKGKSSSGAHQAVMDSMLQRRVPDPFSGQGSLGMVSPRPISVCALSTGIAPEQKTTEEMPGQSVTWYECFDDKCFVHVQEKIKAGYYPQENGERKPLSKGHQRHPKPEQRRKFGAARTRQEEGSEKTQPDVGALQRQIQQLLDEKQQSLERDEKTQQKLANYQNTIRRMREEIQGGRRTMAGTGFSLGRLKREVDDARKGNQELEHRNHELRKELRTVGRKLLDLGN